MPAYADRINAIAIQWFGARRMDDITEQTRPSNRWHLEKGIPIALIVLLLGQSALGVWYARGRLAVDDDHEKRLVMLEEERRVNNIATRIAVIEGAILEIRRSNERTEELLREALKASR